MSQWNNISLKSKKIKMALIFHSPLGAIWTLPGFIDKRKQGSQRSPCRYSGGILPEPSPPRGQTSNTVSHSGNEQSHIGPGRLRQCPWGCPSSPACYAGVLCPPGSPEGWSASRCLTWRSRSSGPCPRPTWELLGCPTLEGPADALSPAPWSSSPHQTPSNCRLLMMSHVFLDTDLGLA